MGSSESILKNYIKQFGIQTIFRYIFLQNKIEWLQGQCTRQINLKFQQQVKYVLNQMDQFINSKKESSIEQYKQSKSAIVQKQPTKVKTYQQRHGKSLQNIYGKNHLMDRLNLVKINFHIQVHIAKKKIKKVIQEKIASIQTNLLYQQSQITIPNQIVQKFQNDEKFRLKLLDKFPDVKTQLNKFKEEIILEFNFNNIFWPDYEVKIRQNQLQVEKICNQVEKKTIHMKNDLIGVWNLFVSG